MVSKTLEGVITSWNTAPRKSLGIGRAAKLLKNRSTQQTATDISLNGKLDSPTISTWEALGKLVANAFINAIEPGFDHATGRISNTAPQQQPQ